MGPPVLLIPPSVRHTPAVGVPVRKGRLIFQEREAWSPYACVPSAVQRREPGSKGHGDIRMLTDTRGREEGRAQTEENGVSE